MVSIIKTMKEDVYKSAQTKAVIKYIRDTYGDELEFLWQASPTNAIWRNPRNRKWYAVLMVVAGSRMGLETDEKVEILDLRFDKGEAREFAGGSEGIFPGYHMNKNNWITLVLDGRMEMERIIGLVVHSYELTVGLR